VRPLARREGKSKQEVWGLDTDKKSKVLRLQGMALGRRRENLRKNRPFSSPGQAPRIYAKGAGKRKRDNVVNIIGSKANLRRSGGPDRFKEKTCRAEAAVEGKRRVKKQSRLSNGREDCRRRLREKEKVSSSWETCARIAHQSPRVLRGGKYKRRAYHRISIGPCKKKKKKTPRTGKLVCPLSGKLEKSQDIKIDRVE